MMILQASRFFRSVHFLVVIGLSLVATWGLLTPDPLAVVRRSPFSLLATVSDIIMHISVYSVLAGTSFALTARSRESWVIPLVATLLIVHAIGTELLQQYVPNRTCDPLDALANLCGIAVGAWAALLLFRPASRAKVATGG